MNRRIFHVARASHDDGDVDARERDIARASAVATFTALDYSSLGVTRARASESMLAPSLGVTPPPMRLASRTTRRRRRRREDIAQASTMGENDVVRVCVDRVSADGVVLRALDGTDRVLVARARTREDARLCLLYTSPSPRDRTRSRMPSSA